MKPNKLFLLAISLFQLQILFAKAPGPKVTQFMNNKDWNFVENKGQLPPDPLKGENIKYYGHQGGVYLYCKPGMISFVFTKAEKENNDNISEATGQPTPYPLKGEHSLNAIGRAKSMALVPTYSGGDLGVGRKISTSRTDLVLINSNPNAEIVASDKQEYYENYYTTGDADHGITNVHTFKTVTYKDIYHSIDMVLQAKEQGMEYSFIVHPGGNVGDIKLQWDGTEQETRLKTGGIKYANNLGTMEESAPKSFVDRELVKSRFVKEAAVYGFKVGGYDREKELVIDPTLTWATYYGGSDADQAFAICTDLKNNVYMTGWTLSTKGIATSGVYQTSTAGGSYNNNAFLAKFSNSGKRLWATYYGGSGPNGGFGVCSDVFDNAFITGYSGSADGIATSGAYQTSYGTYGYDAFLAKFDSSGIISWA